MKDIRTQWKALAADRKVTREDIAALCIYRALVKEQVPDGAKSRLHKSFRPVTNKVKLDNGAYPYHALASSVNLIKYSNLYSWLDDNDKSALLAAIITTKAAGLR